MQSIINIMPEREIYCVGGQTLEIGYPWMTTGAIMALELLLNKNLNILEIGIGGSTIFFCKRCKYVISIETNKDWYYKTVRRLSELSITNCNVLLMSDIKEIISYINLFIDNSFDLVSIDPDPVVADRLQLALTVLSKIKQGGWLLLDNYAAGTFKDLRLDWKSFTYDDFDWSGNGTRLYRKEGLCQ